MGRLGFTVWLTGLSGAGKSTLAAAVSERLHALGYAHVQTLDGDIVRQHISRDLGFSRADRDENIRRIAVIAHLLTKNGVPTIVAAISPYREARDQAREFIGYFLEVYVRCPLRVCMARDPKGLYVKALAGQLPNFTGVSDPYEPPVEPDVTVDTDRLSVEAAVERIVDALQRVGYLEVEALVDAP
ncbi:MAG: adenylyl-sulfate kinase [Actinobacteria bacterium]|nr:adenylyl-sulfate kinase [Actinomycetota bacterium]